MRTEFIFAGGGVNTSFAKAVASFKSSNDSSVEEDGNGW